MKRAVDCIGVWLLAMVAVSAVLQAASPQSPADSSTSPAVSWHFDGSDALGLWPAMVPGPQPPLHPLFAADNLAAEFTDGLSLSVPAGRTPVFGHGDSLTVEFWIAPGDVSFKKPVFLFAKGNPGLVGQADDDLNYGVTFERLSDSSMRVGFCFAAEPAGDEEVPKRHQWWSGSISLTGIDWHHIAIPYTFGDPSSVMLFVNGRMQLFSGKWDVSTVRGPVQRDGAFQLGGCSGQGQEPFKGRLDSLEIHRGVLRNDLIDSRYEIKPPLCELLPADVPLGEVRVELCTKGIPGRREWPDHAPAATEVMTAEAFGFFELPKVYVGSGVIGDPPSNTFLRAAGLVEFPAGKHRILLRARGISRLVIDGKTLLETPLMPSSLNGHHLTTEQDNYLDLGPEFRFAPPGNREAWCEFVSSGEKPHLVVLETVCGTIRPGLGETVAAWSREGQDSWWLMTPSGQRVPYTDDGWASYQAEQRAKIDAVNTRRRFAKRAESADFWKMRRGIARDWLATTPEVPVPSLPAGMPAFNAIDHFIGSKIAEIAEAGGVAGVGRREFYESIKPILEQRCGGCHLGGKAMGGLRLDSLRLSATGGDSGLPAITAGNPQESELLRRIVSESADEVMPPKGKRLTEREVATLHEWVEQGAVWPEFDVTTLQLTPLADDLTFLRRVALDCVGVLPNVNEINQFLEDDAEPRRKNAIDRFLDDPRWADHWMGYWQDVLAENPNMLSGSLNNTGPFRWWLYDALRDDLPMDAFVTELILMEGSSGNGGPAGFALAGQNDAPMAEKAAIVAGAFLGVEMKCARCHDSPVRSAKQEQLFQVSAMLSKKPVQVPATSSVATERLSVGGRQPLIQVTLQPGTDVEPVWPFGQFCDEASVRPLAGDAENSRKLLAALITSPANERFAEVMVNRLWERLMGRGLVEDPGDWERAEPTHPALLQWLGRAFVRSGHSLKAISRLVLNSHAYQRASNPDLLSPEAAFAAPPVRRMTAEQIVDSLFSATGKPFRVEEMTFDVDGISNQRSLGRPRRAWMLASTSNERDRPSLTLPRVQAVITVLEAFGWRAARQSPVTLRESELNVLQPAVLANGTMANWLTRLSDDHGITALAQEEQSLEELVETVYLQLLTRRPTDKEQKLAVELLTPGYTQRCVTPDFSEPVKRVRPRYTAWSNHLDGPANALAADLERAARRGDPPTKKLAPEWRERLEDLLWQILNRPDWIAIR